MCCYTVFQTTEYHKTFHCDFSLNIIVLDISLRTEIETFMSNILWKDIKYMFVGEQAKYYNESRL